MSLHHCHDQKQWLTGCAQPTPPPLLLLAHNNEDHFENKLWADGESHAEKSFFNDDLSTAKQNMMKYTQ